MQTIRSCKTQSHRDGRWAHPSLQKVSTWTFDVFAVRAGVFEYTHAQQVEGPST